MTVRTTLSFTERHHNFILEQVEEGSYASQSALVADAIETLIRQRDVREAALVAMTEEIRARFSSPPAEYIPSNKVLANLGIEKSNE